MPILDDDSQKDEILIIAAEASSCMYAIRLIEEWKKTFPQHHFFGVGDQAMAEAGVECLGYAEDLAVVGIQEVISHWTEIKTTFNSILDHCEKKKPKFAILLDYPGFNLRMAKKLKEQGIPVVYYISPQLWAWKKGRIKQVREYVDDMLVVFPFEVDFYKSQNVEAHFVGHPLVEVVEEDLSKGLAEKSEEVVLGLMPGSRKSEINHNFLVQLKAAEILKKEHNIKVKVLVAPTLKTSNLKILAGELGNEVEFVKGTPTDMIKDCDYILTASGTATLQVALCEKPMIVMYRMNSVTAVLAKMLVRSVKAFCIVNLIAQEMIVPEFFQEKANPSGLAQAISDLINNKQKKDKMISDLIAIKEKLGDGRATLNVVAFLKKKYYSL